MEVISGDTFFGGSEALVVMIRSKESIQKGRFEYKLLATTKTSTMQKEVMEAAAEGYQFVGFSTGSTFFGGNEVVTIMRRPRDQAASP